MTFSNRALIKNTFMSCGRKSIVIEEFFIFLEISHRWSAATDVAILRR